MKVEAAAGFAAPDAREREERADGRARPACRRLVTRVAGRAPDQPVRGLPAGAAGGLDGSAPAPRDSRADRARRQR